MSLKGCFIVPHPPLIIPAVGNGQELMIRKTVDAYEKVGRDIAAIEPQTIIIISPHSIMYGDYIHISPGSEARGDFGLYGAPNVGMQKRYDEDLVQELTRRSAEANIPAGTLGERDKALDHGVMIPLYFVDRYADKSYDIVRIAISGLPPLTQYRFGELITESANALDRDIVIIASGDLSHKLVDTGPYGYVEEGPQFDKEVTEAMATGDFMRFLTFDESFTDTAAECGLRAFIQMAGALDGKAVRSELLSYEGPFGVGYAVATFEITGDDPARKFGDKYEELQKTQLSDLRRSEDPYVSLARETLENYVKTRRQITLPSGLPDEMTNKRAGVFVSLKKHGQLRGCIGTISPTTASIAEEVIRNAIAAGIDDPRFNQVSEEELDELIYSVDILREPEPINSIEELDVKKYGVIVSRGTRRGLLLPNLEGVDTPEEQVEIALQKAHISPNEAYEMERFEVVRHK